MPSDSQFDGLWVCAVARAARDADGLDAHGLREGNEQDHLWVVVVTGQEARAVLALVERLDRVGCGLRVQCVEHAELARVDERVERVAIGVLHFVVMIMIMIMAVVVVVIVAAHGRVLVVAVLHLSGAWCDSETWRKD
jgi:hypothetical protein